MATSVSSRKRSAAARGAGRRRRPTGGPPACKGVQQLRAVRVEGGQAVLRQAWGDTGQRAGGRRRLKARPEGSQQRRKLRRIAPTGLATKLDSARSPPHPESFGPVLPCPRLSCCALCSHAKAVV
eukprot:scaffold6117_cov118-Isochrysis_galbana.AAC.4